MSTEASAASVRTTVISGKAAEAIRRHGSAEFPYECCGALIHVNGTIVEALPLKNTAGGGAARRFRIGPDGYREAVARAKDHRGTLAGFYHSHPNEPARPAQDDHDHARPNLTN